MTTIDSKSNMYKGAKIWNPFKGCRFDCTYCGLSFQRQSKRQGNRCRDCYNYIPHYHVDRLNKIPSAQIIFVCGNADISFCDPAFTRRIIERIKKHNLCCPGKTYYFQSKRPAYFAPFVPMFPDNVVLLTTLETNRRVGYAKISKAPPPPDRYRQFLALEYSRKGVTIKPVLTFDAPVLAQWVRNIGPEFVYLGLNSKPESVTLPGPSPIELQQFMRSMNRAGIEIRAKRLPGIDLGQFSAWC